MNNEKLAIPIQQAFKIIGVSGPTGYSLVAAGTLKTFMIGRRRYTSRKLIDEALDRLVRKTKPPTPQKRTRLNRHLDEIADREIATEGAE